LIKVKLCYEVIVQRRHPLKWAVGYFANFSIHAQMKRDRRYNLS
jgi:hypothetical protein